MSFITRGYAGERTIEDLFGELLREITRAGLLDAVETPPPVPTKSEKGETGRGGRIISLEEIAPKIVAFEGTNDFSVTPKTTYSDMSANGEPT